MGVPVQQPADLGGGERSTHFICTPIPRPTQRRRRRPTQTQTLPHTHTPLQEAGPLQPTNGGLFGLSLGSFGNLDINAKGDIVAAGGTVRTWLGVCGWGKGVRKALAWLVSCPARSRSRP